MKIFITCPAYFKLPLEGYGGTEQICMYLADEYTRAGHQVSMLAHEESTLPPGVELVPVPPMCGDEQAFSIYRERLEDFDIIHDNSFESWAYLESIGQDPILPIVHTCHTDPIIWGAPPPIQYPSVVGISKSHAHRLSLAYQIPTRCVYNGIDTEFYRPPAEGSQRNGKFLWLGRYTAEKDPLSAMQLAKRLRVPLDCFGDTTIVSSQEYVERCRQEADGLLVRWFPGVSRQQTVELYQTYRALLYIPAWQEPFGLILAEAQACGLPVLTLSNGSTSELVYQGVSGYVCDNIGEMEAIIQKGCLASIKTEDCVTMGRGFNKEAMALGYLELFEQVLAGHPW